MSGHIEAPSRNNGVALAQFPGCNLALCVCFRIDSITTALQRESGVAEKFLIVFFACLTNCRVYIGSAYRLCS